MPNNDYDNPAKTNPYRVGDSVKVTYPIPKNEEFKGIISRVLSCADGIYSLEVDDKTFTFTWDELTIYKETSKQS